MCPETSDDLAGALATGVSRRAVLKSLAATVAGGMLAPLGVANAARPCRGIGKGCRSDEERMVCTASQLPVPGFFEPRKVGEIWRVPYGERAAQASDWARSHGIRPAAADKVRVALMGIDVQNTFCIPGAELFVGGASGTGAVDDNVRLCEFIYRNLSRITSIFLTMDTHRAMQIFYPVYWVDEFGNHPAPMTIITVEDVKTGKWRVNPGVAKSVADGNYVGLQRQAEHYVEALAKGGKYPLIIWPYHAMLGGIGHAIVSAVEEAVFFHTIARSSQAGFEFKGGNPLTENYSIFRPEVLEGPAGPIAQKNTRFLQTLLAFDYVAIAGQAKSHCVAWTIDDLLTEIMAQDPSLVRKVYLIEDCTSPVVVPGVVDFSKEADAAFARFASAGMHVVRSDQPIESWPGVAL
jgi:nicotinamidase-related amidase